MGLVPAYAKEYFNSRPFFALLVLSPNFFAGSGSSILVSHFELSFFNSLVVGKIGVGLFISAFFQLVVSGFLIVNEQLKSPDIRVIFKHPKQVDGWTEIFFGITNLYGTASTSDWRIDIQIKNAEVKFDKRLRDNSEVNYGVPSVTIVSDGRLMLYANYDGYEWPDNRIRPNSDKPVILNLQFFWNGQKQRAIEKELSLTEDIQWF